MNDFVMVDDCKTSPKEISFPGLTARRTYFAIVDGYINDGWDEETEEDEEELLFKTIFRKDGQMVMVTLTEFI